MPCTVFTLGDALHRVHTLQPAVERVVRLVVECIQTFSHSVCSLLALVFVTYHLR